jgi:hypothetical protein
MQVYISLTMLAAYFCHSCKLKAVFQIRIHRIHMLLDLLVSDPLLRGMHPHIRIRIHTNVMDPVH